MTQPTIAILGGGLSGLGAAWQLTRRGLSHVCVLEENADVGGLAGSFELGGLPVDYGSHRLHPACDPQILSDLRELLAEDLLTRPRHGRIRLMGRWVHFPLKPLDLLTSLPWGFQWRAGGDLLRKMLPVWAQDERPSFASVLERGLGRTLCREFYFPYAQKLWGLSPGELSPIQAYRRVSAGSMGQMLRKVLAGARGSSTAQQCFFYPRGGFGQITRAMATAARAGGADLRLGARVRAIYLGPPHRIEFEQQGRLASVQADCLWSTIPAPILLRRVRPAAPHPVREASRRLQFRSMVLIYLVLEQGHFSEYDAHYFPGPEIPLTRLSEPKNYSARTDPPDRTVLCGELPCSVNDETWRTSDPALAQRVQQSLAQCELPIQARVIDVTTRRVTHAYPLYHHGYEEHFRAVDGWLDGLDGMLSLGRQGLFTHDNIHHALAMAYAASRCLNDAGGLDKEQWRQCRVEFDKHVVVD